MQHALATPWVPLAAQQHRRTRGSRDARTRTQRQIAVSASHSDTARSAETQRAPTDVSNVPRRKALVSLAGTCGTLWAAGANAAETDKRVGKIVHSDKEWLEIVGQDSYRILRQAKTELPWTSPLNFEKRKGTFVCAGCGNPLYESSTKYDSGTGWPSFYKAINGSVKEVPDFSIMFLPRAEIRCAKCEGHLGHVFDDGPAPTGMRYCMNGLALRFEPSA